MQVEEAVANSKTAETEVDNDDDAILLLKALAGQDPEVRRCSAQSSSEGRGGLLAAVCVSHWVWFARFLPA